MNEFRSIKEKKKTKISIKILTNDFKVMSFISKFKMLFRYFMNNVYVIGFALKFTDCVLFETAFTIKSV